MMRKEVVMKVRTVFMLIVLFSIGMGTLSAEGMKDASAPKVEQEHIVFRIGALKGPTGIGMIRLFEEKPFFGTGVESAYEASGNPDLLVSKLLSGEVDAAVLPTNVAAKLYAKKVPIVMGAVTGFGVLYMLSSDPTIQSLSDIRGKEIHNAGKGATPDVLFRYLVKQEGLDPDKDVAVNFAYAHQELAQLLIAGKISTAVLPEPFATMVLMGAKQARVAVDLQKQWSTVQHTEASYPMSCVVLKKDFADKHRDAVKQFLAEYAKSIEWVNAHPDLAGGLVEKHELGMTKAVAASAIPRCNLRFVSAGDAKPLMDQFLSVLLGFNPESIGGTLPDEGFYLR